MDSVDNSVNLGHHGGNGSRGHDQLVCTVPSLVNSNARPMIRAHSTGLLDSTNRNNRPPVTAFKTNFTLDRDKQVKKLFKDTFAADYEIEVNSNNENVNVQCNLGFYSTVAKPVMEQLSFGPSPCINDVTVRCHDITQRTDQGGAATTTVIIFRMHQHNLSIGQATVHMHHTARKVQIQGSALLPPDNIKAPVWFVQHVLKDRFNALARSAASDINKLNQTVGDLVSRQISQPNTVSSRCAGCKASFNGRSSPEQCPQCKLFFHKFKCFPTENHACKISKRRTTSMTGTPMHPPAVPGDCPTPVLGIGRADPDHPIAAPLLTTQTKPSSVATSTLGAVTSSPVSNSIRQSSTPPHTTPVFGMPSISQAPAPAASESPDPNTSVPQPLPSTSSAVPSSQTPSISLEENPISQAPLDPTVPPFVSQRNPKQGNTQGKGKNKNKSDKSGGDCALEYARYEVNITKAIVSDQEATIKDLKYKNGILEARVAELEKKQKQDIYDRYFPLPGVDNAAKEPTNQQKPANCCSNASHFVLPLCVGQHSHHPSNGSSRTGEDASVKDITSIIADLTSSLDNLKYRLDILTDVSIPKMIREALQSHCPVSPIIPADNCQPSSPGPAPVSVVQRHDVTSPPQEDNNISCTSMDETALNNSKDLN